MPPKQETYNNLIDLCIDMEEDDDLSGNAPAMFTYLLTSYFFKKESVQSKNFSNFINEAGYPPTLEGKASLFDIDVQELETFVNGSTINDSFAGKIMLSPQFLKAFYSHHPPSFSKLPEDIKFELIDRVKEKNSMIVAAFEKMVKDRDSDKNRQVITLVALILKNVHRKTGRPFNRLEKNADTIIRDLFKNTDSLFLARETQVSDLKDETKIKELIKKFFIIKQFKDIQEISAVYKAELDRYIKRGIKASI